MMWRRILDIYYAVTGPAVALLHRAGIKPVSVTLAGLALNTASGAAFAAGAAAPALALFILAGICDTFDGQLARKSGTAGAWGAFIDSTVDRISETAVHLGLAWYYLSHGRPVIALLAFSSLAAAYMVSYTRARAEGVGIACKTGIMQRPHRFLALALGGLAGYRGIVPALWLILILSSYTVGERIMTVRKGAAA